MTDKKKIVKNVVLLLCISVCITLLSLAYVIYSDYKSLKSVTISKIETVDNILTESIKRSDFVQIQSLLYLIWNDRFESINLKILNGQGTNICIGQIYPANSDRKPSISYDINDYGTNIAKIAVFSDWLIFAESTALRIAPITVVLNLLVLVLTYFAQLPMARHARKLSFLLESLYSYDGTPQKRDDLAKLASNERDKHIYQLVSGVTNVIDKEKELSKKANLITVGEIVNHVAHDLRSPLQTLLTSIERIEKKAQGDIEIEAYTEAVRQSAERIKLMADDLLDYKKAREIQPSSVSIEKLLGDSLKDMLVPAQQKGVKVLTSVSSNMTLNVDAYKLQRVIANIALNAIQAIPHEHGVVEIAVSPSPQPSPLGGEGDVLITIADNGCGIKQEHLAKVFDCSFTFGKKGGTGLGLAYCLNVIEAHKGTITVESEEGKGTTFTISLPESVILSKGNNVASKLPRIDADMAGGPAVVKPNWMLVANEPETKKTWHELSAKHESIISTEIEALEDLIKKKIDYSELKGVIVDCVFGQEGGLGMTDVVDIAEHVRSKGVKNIHLLTSEQLPEKFVKRFETRGVSIRSKPLNEDAYKIIFQRDNL